MRFIQVVTLFVVSFFFASVGFSETIHYKANFEGNNVYDITIAPTAVSWKGLSGEDKGRADTITNYKHTNLADNIEILQWRSKPGSYITLIVDHEHLKVVCAGQASKTKGDWLWNGTLERLPA